MAEPVRVERDGPLAVLTFDAPPLNLFDATLIAALRTAVADVAADPPRGLLVRAEGRVVSGGVDVHLFDGLSPQDAAELWTELLAMIHTV
jgi:enoyl-CoA hydratase